MNEYISSFSLAPARRYALVYNLIVSISNFIRDVLFIIYRLLYGMILWEMKMKNILYNYIILGNKSRLLFIIPLLLVFYIV